MSEDKKPSLKPRLTKLRRGTLTAFTAASMLVGCGGYPSEELGQPIIPAGDQGAQVLVDRPLSAGAIVVVFSLLVDDQPVANISNGQKVEFRIPSGMRVIKLDCNLDRFDTVLLPAEAGKTYRLVVDVTPEHLCALKLVGSAKFLH